MTTTITLDDRELAHVLAALRQCQEDQDGNLLGMPHFADIEPLGDADLDDLCESINTSESYADLQEGQYLVTWRMDFEADSHGEAAALALAVHRKRDSVATVFDVTGHDGTTQRIDFNPEV